MEKEFVEISEDGRLYQQDQELFKGRELGSVEPEKLEEVKKYYSGIFSDLERYVNASLEKIKEIEDPRERGRHLDRLRKEILHTDAIGDFDLLLKKVSSHEISQDDPKDSKETGDLNEAESASGKESTGEETTADSDKENSSEESSGDEEEPEIIISEFLGDFVELAKKANELAGRNDWQYIQQDLENLRFRWNELLQAATHLANEPGYNYLLAELEKAEKAFAERRAAHKEKRREQRKSNLEKRMRLLEQLQQIVDKKRWQAFKQVNQLNDRWEQIRDLPQDEETRNQEKLFRELFDTFNEKKVAYLVKKAQKEEENLTGKLAILDKMAFIVASGSSEDAPWVQLDEEMEVLTRQWKKIGHVPLEQSDIVWDQFKAIREQYFDRKFEFNPSFRKETQKNIRKKTIICENAEALLEKEDLAAAVREINNLHKRWKKVGPIPKGQNDELWERFNEATRKFNDRKNASLDIIRDQEHENYQKKLELCEKAESLSESTDWQRVTRELDELMQNWKDIGPVPRRKSGKIWKRFKKAMDDFYNNRRKHYKEVRDQQKKNLDEKSEVVAELGKLLEVEDTEEMVRLARALQERFKKIGFVPIKKKDKIEKEYKEVCDRIYQRVRKSGKQTGEQTLAMTPAAGSRHMRTEFVKLKKECDKLQEEILRYNDTKTFINPSGKGNDLIDEVQKKIDRVQKRLDEKLEKLEKLRRELDG